MDLEYEVRDVFYVSDGTAITCETIGHVVLGQFNFSIVEKTFPFIENEEKLENLIQQIEISYLKRGDYPLVFFSIVIPELRKSLLSTNAYFYDVIESFVEKIRLDTQIDPQPKLQRSRSINKNSRNYFKRIAAIEYTLSHDDGISLNQLESADIILLGVSRSGKTPTSLYMAMQFGLNVVNYPIVYGDDSYFRLSPKLEMQRHKLFGLTIDERRLNRIRENRFADSDYSSSSRCFKEVQQVEALFRREAIPYIDTTSLSVEEITTRILEKTGLCRRLF
ncbi:kinase/pyrophosphorylase [Vibrio alginolyticus]|nr:kinase/pyrophosphorylase [Vibrio alginolyticus]